jgi:hypothetical protein
MRKFRASFEYLLLCLRKSEDGLDMKTNEERDLCYLTGNRKPEIEGV